MARPRHEPKTHEADALTTELLGPIVQGYIHVGHLAGSIYFYTANNHQQNDGQMT